MSDYDEAPPELHWQRWQSRRMNRSCTECRCSRAQHATGCPETPDEQIQGDEE